MKYRELLDKLNHNLETGETITVRFRKTNRDFYHPFPPAGMVAVLRDIKPSVSLYFFPQEQPRRWADVTDEMVEKIPVGFRNIRMLSMVFDFRPYCGYDAELDRMDAYHASWMEEHLDAKGEYEFVLGYSIDDVLRLDDDVDIFDILENNEVPSLTAEESLAATRANKALMDGFCKTIEDTIQKLDKNDICYAQQIRKLLRTKEIMNSLF